MAWTDHIRNKFEYFYYILFGQSLAISSFVSVLHRFLNAWPHTSYVYVVRLYDFIIKNSVTLSVVTDFYPCLSVLRS